MRAADIGTSGATWIWMLMAAADSREARIADTEREPKRFLTIMHAFLSAAAACGLDGTRALRSGRVAASLHSVVVKAGDAFGFGYAPCGGSVALGGAAHSPSPLHSLV